MAIQFVLVKTAYPVDAPMDLLDLDSDPTFKADGYRRMVEQMCSNVEWHGEEGTGSMFGRAVTLLATDACLFMNFAGPSWTAGEADQLGKEALALGAVVIDAESADMLPGEFEL